MNIERLRFRFLILCLLGLAVLASSAQGQSGRRQTKPPPAAPVPTPTPEPTPAPKPKDPEAELNFLLGADRNTSTFTTFPLTYYDAVLRGCADRLSTASSAHVEVSQNDISRGEAIKKAKGETNTYVVLMRLVLDDMARSYDDLEIDFVVFAPGTAKVVTSGRGYQNINRTGPIIVGPNSRGSSGALYREQLLRLAGEDVAEKILKALHLNVPVRR